MSVTQDRGGAAGESAAPGWCGLVPWAVFLVSLCAFLPALGQGFVSWDDDRNFVDNPHWRGLSDENVRWMFSESHIGHWQPLTWVSLALDWEIAAGDLSAETADPEALRPVAQQIHLVSTILHAINAMFVFALLGRVVRSTKLGQRAPPGRVALSAGVGALIFAIHPLRVESVAWATERRDVLAGLFLFATLLTWWRGVEGGTLRTGTLLLTLGWFALSLLSKAWGITLPVVLLLFDIWPLRRWRRSDPNGRGLGALIVEKLPFALLAAVAATLAFQAQTAGAQGATAVLGLGEHGIVQRLVQAAYGAMFYVRKTLWPTDLAPLYELEHSFDPARLRYVVSAIAFGLTSLAAWLVRRRWPAVPLSWLTFLVVVSPVLGLVQSGAQIAADRYTYLACVPFAGLATAVLLRVHGTGIDKPVLALSATVLIAAFAATWRQTRVWHSSLTLWTHVAAVEPSSYIAHHNLAAELNQAGRVDEAMANLRRSIEAHPGEGNVQARMTLGGLLLARGARGDAERLYLEGLVVDPQTWYLIQRLEALWGPPGRERVDELWRAAGAADPDDWGVHYEYGQFLARQGRTADAVASWRRATARAHDVPGLESLWAQIGRGELALGQLQEAEGALRQALALAQRAQIWRADVELDLADCLRRTGRAAEARVIAQNVLRRQPTDPSLRARAENLAR